MKPYRLLTGVFLLAFAMSCNFTDSGGSIPGAPAALWTEDAAASHVTLAWQDVSFNEAGFCVQRKTVKDTEFAALAYTAADATGYTDTNVLGFEKYEYRVFSFNDAGNSPFSNIVSVSLYEASDPPESPSMLQISPGSSRSLHLSWQDNAGSEAGFIIERKTGSGGEYREVYITEADTSSWIDSGLIPLTAYYYRVTAFNSAGRSGSSPENSAQTPGYSFAMETVFSAPDSSYTSIALDGSGNPRIAYFDQVPQWLKYAAKTGGTWDVQTVDSINQPGQYCSLVLDGDGIPHVSHWRQAGGPQFAYSYWTGSFWDTLTLVTPAANAAYTSLALTSNGIPVMAGYIDSSGDLGIGILAGSFWVENPVDSSPNMVGKFNSIALAHGGLPVISYYDETFGNLKIAYATSFDKVSKVFTWTINDLPDPDSAGNDLGMYTSLKIDRQGLPHIAYFDGTLGALKYARWDGNAWYFTTVDTGSGEGQYASLALDREDNPHISYYDPAAQDLKYAKWTGDTWITQTVDSGGNIGVYTSIAVDGEGNPHISYSETAALFLHYVRGY